MGKGRLEAFSDGVIAIIITIMVLELKVPHSTDIAELKGLGSVFVSYVLSFIYVGIYWNNHHHLFHAVQKINGSTLWANMHLLFWLSLIPFASGWMGENGFPPTQVALYGLILLFSAISYFILVQTLLAHHGSESVLAKAMGTDFKGKFSLVLYLIALPLTIWNSWISLAIYIVVAIIWLVPDRRIENALKR